MAPIHPEMVPQDGNSTDLGIWTIVLGTVLFVVRKWISKLNPWPLLQAAAVSLNEPLMKKHIGPVIEEQQRQGSQLDRACRVLSKLQGADAALAEVEAEDARDKRWGT